MKKIDSSVATTTTPKRKSKKGANVAKSQIAIAAPITQAEIEKSKVETTTPDGMTGQAPLPIAPIVPTIPANGESEATNEAIKIDSERAEGNTTLPAFVEKNVDNETQVTVGDELSCSVDVWNKNEERYYDNIVLMGEQPREDKRPLSNVLARFEYVPEKMQVGGKNTRYSILRCSDNGLIVGKPFSQSYGLLDNGGFNSVVLSICNELDNKGIKYKIATTGTLMERERSFISIELSEGQDFEIDGRVFQSKLNCLNSIPSNSGCTVTFANNTFCVCCRNTFAMALHNKDGAKFHAAIKHTKGMKAALGDIPRLIEAYFSGNNLLFKQLKAFQEFPVSLGEAESYFAAFVAGDAEAIKTRGANIIERLKVLFTKGAGNKGVTALDMFQAVTEYYTHESAGQTDDKTKQFESSEIGSGANNKGTFYQWLVKHTQERAGFTAIAKVGETLLVQYRKQPNKVA